MYWNVIFCMWSMNYRTAWNECKLLLDAETLFSHAFMVFESQQFHPPLPVRENCPVWLWRNSQTIDSDSRFGVWLWQSLKIRRDIFLTLNGIKWRLKIWFLMAKYTHWYQKRKQCQNSIVRDENACFPVYWNCLKIFFCMLAELFKTKFNLVSLSFYSNDHKKISLPHPLPFESVFLRVCAFETQLWQN